MMPKAGVMRKSVEVRDFRILDIDNDEILTIVTANDHCLIYEIEFGALGWTYWDFCQIVRSKFPQSLFPGPNNNRIWWIKGAVSHCTGGSSEFAQITHFVIGIVITPTIIITQN